jgi:hypothetical protein
MSDVIAHRLERAAQHLGTANPVPYVGGLLNRSFSLPAGHPRLMENTLVPGAAAVESSFSEQEPGALRFTLEPLGPSESPLARRNEATHEARRLVAPNFGSDALRWFDVHCSPFRSCSGYSNLHYGAFFGSSFDEDGLRATKVYYEMLPGQIDALPDHLTAIAREAMRALPSLVPIFTSLTCTRERGHQRVTFVHRGALRLNSIEPLLRQFGLSHQLPSLMQTFGVALGGRFELPEQTVLLAVGREGNSAELELYVLLGRIPDVPANFLELLNLGLAERPRELQALRGWLDAFRPSPDSAAGNFSVLSVRLSASEPARVSLYLRPIEFEINERLVAAAGRYAA